MKTALAHQVNLIFSICTVNLASSRIIHLQIVSFHTWGVKSSSLLIPFHIIRVPYSDFYYQGVFLHFYSPPRKKQNFLIFHKILEYYNTTLLTELFKFLLAELPTIIYPQHLYLLLYMVSTRVLNYLNLSNNLDLFLKKYIHVFLEKSSMNET